MDETRGKFVLKAPYQPSGDQPQAIEALTKGVNAGMKGQVLLGVTGSGKTFTMASVIAQVQRPTLVIAFIPWATPASTRGRWCRFGRAWRLGATTSSAS